MDKITTINKGDLITINGITGYFDGFSELHGLSDITGTESSKVYTGYYHDNYFILNEVYDYGTINYDLLVYIENNKAVTLDEELTDLIKFVHDPEITNAFYKSSYYRSK